MTPPPLTFEGDGAELHPSALAGDDLTCLAGIFEGDGRRSGIVVRDRNVRHLTAGGSKLFRIAARCLPEKGIPRAVRAIVHDGSVFNGYGAAYFQDQRIASLRDKRVAPMTLIERMVTLFVFLDPVQSDDALRVVPGSHCLGPLAAVDCKTVADTLGAALCPANIGDVWAVAKAICRRLPHPQKPLRRRLLEVDFAAEFAPEGWSWVGV